MTSLYSEWEPYPASWTRNLIAAGHVAPGVVDERSIADLRATDLVGRVQFHAFAGIAAWSYALRLAGWADDRPVWTGSCPCQPFSVAGRQGGISDTRHVWPAWFRLIDECRPPVVLGEQVASRDGLAWLDAVRVDMEGAGYAFAAFDLCAAGFGAPHVRQRIYFCAARGMGNTDDGAARRNDRSVHGQEAEGSGGGCVARCGTDGSRDAGADRRVGAGWSACEWIPCGDPERGIIHRPIEPGTFPLAHGVADRLGRLRAYGNSIVAPQAAAFIGAVMDALATWTY